jgi:phytoene synthase
LADELTLYCRDRMAKGSLSFSLASRLLGRREREAILMLYAWCRHCDDATDEPGADKVAVVRELREKTAAALAGTPSEEPVFRGLTALARRVAIPTVYFDELLLGMEMDATRSRYETLSELELYCYRVAGVVGLMYCHIVGVSNEAALSHAAALGTAMQLTNIARDVRDDAALGRIYLPLSWLREAGLDEADFLDPSRREALAGVVARLLDAAALRYESGDAGLLYLPPAAACAAAAARHVYAEIGALVRMRGQAAWDRRAIVPGRRKLLLAARGVVAILRSAPRRLWQPWRPVELTHIWRSPA